MSTEQVAPDIDWPRVYAEVCEWLKEPQGSPITLANLVLYASRGGHDLEDARQSLEATDSLARRGDLFFPHDETGDAPLDLPGRPRAYECLDAAVDFFHSHLDTPIGDHTELGKHPDRPTTAREYFRARGWTDETIERARLGWAPPQPDALINYLMRRGFTMKDVRATGLHPGRIIWTGRYVLPYLDEQGRAIYAIARSTGSMGGAEYDGHPLDHIAGKYGKLAHTFMDASLEEPIFGLNTVREGEPVLITEGIADAISAHQAGLACISPVTTTFKDRVYPELVRLFEDKHVPAVYIVNDAETAGFEEVELPDGTTDLSTPGLPSGEAGAVRTAEKLTLAGYDRVYIGHLPLPAMSEDFDKVDLHDFLQVWGPASLAAVLRSAKPASQHPAFDPERNQLRELDAQMRQVGAESGLSAIPMVALTGMEVGERGKNPLGHVGDSENYFVVTDECLAYDHKRHVGYSPLTFMACKYAGRPAEAPNGLLSDREWLDVWVGARRDGLAEDEPVPRKALRYLALSRQLCLEREIVDGWKLPEDAYNRALAIVEEEYELDPNRPALGGEETSTAAEPEAVSLLPIGALKASTLEERRRAAIEAGLTWPTTEEVRERLSTTIRRAMERGRVVALKAPTSSGKTFTVATTPWLELRNVTGGHPVVQFHATKEARDQAARKSSVEGRTYRVLRAVDETCPVVMGEYDDVVNTPDRTPASEWIRDKRDRHGLSISWLHTALEWNNDGLPCSTKCQCLTEPCVCEKRDCPYLAQWEDIPYKTVVRGGEEYNEPSADVIHATNAFAHVPSLRLMTNMVYDELPSYTEYDRTSPDGYMNQQRIEAAIEAYLGQVGSPARSYRGLLGLASVYAREWKWQVGTDAFNEAKVMEAILGRAGENPAPVPDETWYIRDPDAHTLAPYLAKAAWMVFSDSDRFDVNGYGQYFCTYQPPRIDAHAHHFEGWNIEVARFVLNRGGEFETIHIAPSHALARSVVGLDGHPCAELWKLALGPSESERVLSPSEEQYWRQYERNLWTVKIGDFVRSAGSQGVYLKGKRCRKGTAALVEHLREEYDSAFSTAITPKSFEDDLREIMREAGIEEPRTMHYGEEKSRNDFAAERVGLLFGCIDPGDDYILKHLTLLGLNARASVVECKWCGGEGCEGCDGRGIRREKGRTFEGEDAEAAASLLASVRESHVAQAIGRYGRDGGGAVVFVRTSAVPEELIDYRVADVAWVYSDQQAAVAEALRELSGPATKKEVAEAAGVRENHTYKILRRFEEWGYVRRVGKERQSDLWERVGDNIPSNGVFGRGR